MTNDYKREEGARKRRKALRALDEARDDHKLNSRLLKAWACLAIVWVGVMVALVVVNIITRPIGYDMGGWNVLGFFWFVLVGALTAVTGFFIGERFIKTRTAQRDAEYDYRDIIDEIGIDNL